MDQELSINVRVFPVKNPSARGSTDTRVYVCRLRNCH